MPTARFQFLRAWLLVLCIAALGAVYWPYFAAPLTYLQNPFEDLRHGWLVLLASALAVWQVRAQIRRVVPAPDWRGPALLLAGLALFWFGTRGAQPRLAQIGIIGSIPALALAFWGTRLARLLLFPAANLLFLLPLGFLEAATAPLRTLSASLACAILNGLMIAAQRSGTLITVPGTHPLTLDITDPHICLLRSVLAVASLAAGYAWLTQKTWSRKALLFSCFLPIAVLGDITRICSTVLAVRWTGHGTSLFFATYASYLVLAIVLLGLVLAGIVIARITPAPPPTVPQPADDAHGSTACDRRAPALAVAGMSLLFLGVTQAAPQRPPQIEPDNQIAVALPARINGLVGRNLWFCQNDRCGHVVREDQVSRTADGHPGGCPRCGSMLDTRAWIEKLSLYQNPRILRRAYERADGETYTVTVVVSNGSRQSLHRPELCLPLQGSSIQATEPRTLALAGRAPIRVRVVTIARKDGQRMQLVYWFVHGRTETASHWTRIFRDTWDLAVHNRVNRWSMVTVFTPDAVENGRAEAWPRLEEFVGAWYPGLVQR
jgi:exosortase